MNPGASAEIKCSCSLKQFASEHTAEELMSPEELNKIRGALQDAKQAAEAAKQAAIAAALQDGPGGAESAGMSTGVLTLASLAHSADFAV